MNENLEDLIDDAVFDDFGTLAEELKLSGEQAQGIWDWIVDGATRFVEEINDCAHGYCDCAERRLRAEFGGEYDAKIKAARAMVYKYGGDELASFLKKSGLANCGELVGFLMKIADAAAEDRGLVGEKAQIVSNEDRIKAEIARLSAVPAYMQASHPDHDSVVRQVYGLRKRLFGEN
nr:MAG TPA: putative protease [Caudoviricetes sp.]